jgi:hypothetical protein
VRPSQGEYYSLENAFDKLLNQILKKEEPSTAPNTKPIYGDQNLLTEEEDVQRIDVDRDIPVQQMPVQEDPVVKMFRGIKEVVDFNITIDLE